MCEELSAVQTAGNQFSDAAFRLKVSMIQILLPITDIREQ